LYGLAKQYGYATNYTAITHPSEPNYIAMGFGDTMGDTADHGTAQSYAAPTVFGQAVSNGKTAKVYSEDMVGNCRTTDSGKYYVKHNPWPFAPAERTACQAGNVPMGANSAGAMLTDINAGTLPNVGMAVPNICNDAHDCSLGTADTWLKGWLPKIMAGPDYQSGHLAIVVTADEDDRNSGNKVLTVVIHASQHSNVVTTSLTHYSWTRLATDVVGASCIRKGCAAANLATAFGLPLG
jgi:Phosphoesterase family.